LPKYLCLVQSGKALDVSRKRTGVFANAIAALGYLATSATTVASEIHLARARLGSDKRSREITSKCLICRRA
jgi:hypothetical protein